MVILTETMGFACGYVKACIRHSLDGITMCGITNNRVYGRMLRGIHSIREENRVGHPANCDV